MFGTSSVPPNPEALAAACDGLTETPDYFNLVVRKTTGVGLGIDVAYTSSATWMRNGIFVQSVAKEGIVAAWNARSQESQRVHPGDFIFQVNDIHGDTILMLQEMKVQQVLTVYVMHITDPDVLAEELGLSSEREPTHSRAVELEEDGRRARTAADEGRHDLEEELEEDRRHARTAADIAPGHNSRRPAPRSQRVEELLAHYATLSDEALSFVIVMALKSRPHIRDAVFGIPYQ